MLEIENWKLEMVAHVVAHFIGISHLVAGMVAHLLDAHLVTCNNYQMYKSLT